MDSEAFCYIKYFKTLQTAIDKVQEEHEYAAKASGLLNVRISFFGLKLSYQILAPSEQCSTDIQAVDITDKEAMKGAHLLASHLTSMRNDHIFNRFYEQTFQESRSLTEKPKFTRNRKVPHRIDHGHLHHISIHVQRIGIAKFTTKQ